MASFNKTPCFSVSQVFLSHAVCCPKEVLAFSFFEKKALEEEQVLVRGSFNDVSDDLLAALLASAELGRSLIPAGFPVVDVTILRRAENESSLCCKEVVFGASVTFNSWLILEGKGSPKSRS